MQEKDKNGKFTGGGRILVCSQMKGCAIVEATKLEDKGTHMAPPDNLQIIELCLDSGDI